MSRHRNIRSMNYSEEYEGFDDVYGHSVEDDHCISPSEARFLYDRTRHPQMSVFINEDNYIAEEDEQNIIGEWHSENSVQTRQMAVDEEKLRLCLDDIQNVIGDTLPQSVVEKIVLKYDYDIEKSLDHLLNVSSEKAVLEDSFQKKSGKIKSKDTGPKIVNILKPPKNEARSSKEASEPEMPLITIVSSGAQTKGFEIPESDKINLNVNYSKCASPSGRVSPNEPEESAKTGSSEKVTVKASLPNRDAELQFEKERGHSKEVLHMVVIGHVDAGKSTLMGRLLFALGEVNKKTLHKYEQESKKMGKQSFVYAWILDETGEERSRGITMDVGQAKFSTKTKIVHLLDAPGHKDFIPNMIMGATQADVAVLVVDATRGEFETGFESGGQTREHALLVRSLGVSQLAVVVNKLDTVGWSEERFREISSKLKAFLKQAGYRDSDVVYVPCSGLAGENLNEKSSQELLVKWYDGPCLLDVIDNFKVPTRPLSKPLRISVSDVYKGTGSGFCITGHVETGMVRSGDKVLVMPHNEFAHVKGIFIDDAPVQTAFAGDGVSLTLANYDIQNISVGYVLSDAADPVPVTSKFEARIVLFNLSTPITTGYPVIMHAHSVAEQAVVAKLIAHLNKSTGEIIKKRPRCLTKNSNAIVEIETSRPICLEPYRETKELGRFMLRVGGASIAAGLVTKLL